VIRGEFGDVIAWSAQVSKLHDEIRPLVDASGSVDERVTAYLRSKIDAIVALLLPAATS
jgi:hypothetical protein